MSVVKEIISEYKKSGSITTTQLFDRLEKEHPSWFSREAYSSAELAADIYIFSEVLDAKDWNIDEAYNVLNIQAGEMFLFDKDLNEDANERVSDWIYRKMANA